MDYNSGDYFTYKRNKMKKETSLRQKKPISKLSFLIQLFGATFIIIFILIVLSIMKYSAKVDIEYSRNDIAETDNSANSAFVNYGNIQEGEQLKIDKRLYLIWQEENAPSEAKIIADNKQNNNMVMDFKLIEENRKLDKKYTKEFKQKQELKQQQKKQEEEQEQASQAPKPSVKNIVNEIKPPQKQEAPKPSVKENVSSESGLNTQASIQNANIVIMSRVLIGRYSSFEDAQAMQNTIKSQNPSLTPYVKKVGNVFAIQMGSYQDFAVARRFAQTLQSKGYEVWIYQQ